MIVLLISFQIARLQYEGGGDWYNDPDVIPNLVRYIKKHVNIDLEDSQAVVHVSSKRLFDYPVAYLTGHGHLYFRDIDAENLRKYLISGGFLYVDDDYGLDRYFRREIKKVFPDRELVEIPLDHPLFNMYWKFPEGLPKIHEHYPGPPKAYGIFYGGRLVVLYTYNSNISDGWTPRHNDPPRKREEALRFGMNIILFATMMQ